MKILLVLPATERHRVVPGGEVPKRKMLRFSVLGLTTVAALTPARHEVLVRDENVEALDFETDADVVGVTFMTGLANRAYEIAAEFKRRGKLVVAGGYHPTLMPEEAARHFDIVVAGEAEGVWPRVVADIERGEFRRIYRNVGMPDLRETPVPRRELLERMRDEYVTTNAVQTGRGCPHQCRFCSVAAFFKGSFRTRPQENVLAELAQVPKVFMFVDDNIISDPEYAKALFRAMAPMGKRWVSQCSIKIADDPELLRLAYEAGCRGLFLGIETINQDNLTAVQKDINDPRQYERRIRLMHEAGIGVQAGMIVGLDSDDVTVFEKTLDFLQSAELDALQLAILTPQPGTPLHEDFAKAGRLLHRDWGRYDFRHAVIQPKHMTPEELQAGADWLYAQYYRLDRIILRTLRLAFKVGVEPAYLGWRLGLTYRYNNIREGIVGRNPARKPGLLARLWEGVKDSFQLGVRAWGLRPISR
ncbi:MAG TPA: B12-binding domain-containing radical SAM protein [Elusimicrobia bacterium]|nr:B12-binding domain-containing radical SAM protein [Elusimicrobiota bacterium]